MPRLTSYFTTTAAGLVMATTALAQTASDQGSAGDSRSADTVTCADIVTMDRAVVPGVLYFVAGYQEGSRSGMNGMSSDSSGAATDGTSADAGTSGSEGSGSAGSDTGAGAGTGTGASDTEGSGGGSDQTTDMEQSSSAGGSDISMNSEDQMRVMRVAGLYEIPVETIMTVCNDRPDDRVGDVMQQQSDAGQGSSN